MTYAAGLSSKDGEPDVPRRLVRVDKLERE